MEQSERLHAQQPMESYDEVSAEERQYMKDEVARVLQALSDTQVKYAVWGAAATRYHGDQWLWKCPDYEILVEDWFDGPVLRRVMEAITEHCSSAWEYDSHFDAAAWAQARGDSPPHRPYRRFRHKTHPSNLGVVIVPSVNTYVMSMHHDDLVRDEANPVWIYPSLKNFVESSLRLWSYEGRNSSLVELADVSQARKLTETWAVKVGMDLPTVRRADRPELPSLYEIWNEIWRSALTRRNSRRASARFRARKAAKEAQRLIDEEEGRMSHIEQPPIAANVTAVAS